MVCGCQTTRFARDVSVSNAPHTSPIMSPPSLPAEVWELILRRAGPLELCKCVGATPSVVGAMRLQQWARDHTGHTGDCAEVRMGEGAWLRGTLVNVGAVTGVRVATGVRVKYFFLQCERVRARKADGTRVFFVNALRKLQ